MGTKKIYECKRCVQYFKGRTVYDYHMNAHKRTDPKPPKVVAPKPATVYTTSNGE